MEILINLTLIHAKLAKFKIDLLKKIVNEKRNSEHLEREEQVNAMFERILEISDIENKIIAKIDYNLDNNGTDGIII